MKNIWFILVIVVLFSFTKKQPKLPVLVDEGNFKTVHDGKQVDLYTLRNSNGLVVQITNYGGKVVTLWTPDKNGGFDDIVRGFATIDEYFKTREIYFGSIIGRYANRVRGGEFTLNDTGYHLAKNNGGNALHGGIKGYNNVVWDAKQIDDKTLDLNYFSPDMEEGYPGNLNVKVVYQLTDNNELKIEYRATTDEATPVNLTNHSYFNLQGAGSSDVKDHILQLNSDGFTAVDAGLIPTGKIATVEGTPMDFRQPTSIGAHINENFEQLKFGRGYDHYWVLNKAANGLTLAAKVVEPNSGRTMEVFTNEPGIQFYSCNSNGNVTGKGGKTYMFRSALCLETQHFPNSPNNPNFPSTILEPGNEYYSICVYKFGVEE